MLESLGLTGHAEAVYRALLSSPGSDIQALADHVGMAESEIAAALDTLADLALIGRSWPDTGSVVPVSPETGLQTLLAKQKLELAQRQQEIEAGQRAAAALVADYLAEASADGSRLVERLDGVAAVRRRMRELGASAERETLALAPGGPQLADNREASQALTRRLLERSVTVKTVYLDSVRNDPASLEYAHWLSRHGGESRSAPVLPLRLQIVDRTSALVPIDPEDSAQGALVVGEPGLIAALVALFESVWNSATPLGAATARNSGPFTPQERELLRLLSQGLTDDAAARKLGISLRTERRMISDLSDQLGAQSRFQLGQRASEHGLLP